MFRTRPALLASVLLTAALAPAQSTAPADPTATPAPAPQTRTRPCATAVHRQFDFWIGQWDVMGANGKFAGRAELAQRAAR